METRVYNTLRADNILDLSVAWGEGVACLVDVPIPITYSGTAHTTHNPPADPLVVHAGRGVEGISAHKQDLHTITKARIEGTLPCRVV